MFLHLADDSIFLDYALEQFEEVAPGQSIYFVNCSDPQRIKNLERVIIAETNSMKYQNILERLNEYEAVILHALTKDKIEVVNKAKVNVKFVWMFWGADGYYLNAIIPKLYSKKTKSVLIKNTSEPNMVWKLKKYLLSKDFFNIPFSLIKYKKYPDDFLRRKAIRRMNYCAPVIDEDYLMIQKYLNPDCKLLPFSYGSLETMVPEFEKEVIEKKQKGNELRILLGNSADPSNNHLDILYLLKTIDYKGEIICPLSYGNNEYAGQIIENGMELFSKNFVPLTEFMLLPEYQKIIKSCSIVIMNHYRQQAMGNIVASLWYGAKIFLNYKNPVYSFLKKNGAVVFSINNISEQYDCFSELGLKEKKLNSTFVINNYSKEKVLAKTKSLINIIKMDHQFSSLHSNSSK